VGADQREFEIFYVFHASAVVEGDVSSGSFTQVVLVLLEDHLGRKECRVAAAAATHASRHLQRREVNVGVLDDRPPDVDVSVHGGEGADYAAVVGPVLDVKRSELRSQPVAHKEHCLLVIGAQHHAGGQPVWQGDRERVSPLPW